MLLWICDSSTGAFVVPCSTASRRSRGIARAVTIMIAFAIAATSSRAQPTDTPDDFDHWRERFRDRARSQGIPEAVFDRAFEGVAPDAVVLDKDRNQPEFTKQPWAYLQIAVSKRLDDGRRLVREHRKALDQAAKRHGVPAETIAAVWGVESAYGKNTGEYLAVRSLATLAFEGRRREYFEGELLAALRILSAGDVPPDAMRGSWAGALGQAQFMPSSYLELAVDGDGDGRRDLWGTLPDVFGSIANFLSERGWRTGEAWGTVVRLPEGFDIGLADGDTRRDVRAWAGLGVRRGDGTPLADGAAIREDMPGALYLPAGARGPAALLFGNFDAFLAYNPGQAYALALGFLSDALATGIDPVAGATWPVDEPALTRDQKVELQTLLLERGFDPGAPDGVLGRRTRAALREYQRTIGVPPDGFPTVTLLERLRQTGGDSGTTSEPPPSR